MLHRFDRTRFDGGNPTAGLVLDPNGSLYGTTQNGGRGQYGTVIALMPPAGGMGAWSETVLHSFRDDEHGAGPAGGVIFDVNGNLCGTTAVATNTSAQGNVFKMKPPAQQGGVWGFSVAHTFTGSPDGASPSAHLVLSTTRRMFSTTQLGGTGSVCQGGCGTVFQLEP